MMNKDYDVVIIGAGFAGIKAALTLENYDLNICVIDEGVLPGGQFIRYKKDGENSSKIPTYNKGLDLVKKFNASSITYLRQSELIFINEEKEILVKLPDDSLKMIVPKTIIFATGAREIVQPFKGWDLPGVITTGAMQILLKTSGKTFCDEIVIAGSGILHYAAGATWLEKGGKIKSFYDANTFPNKFKMLTSALASSEKRSDFFAMLPDMMKIQMNAKNSVKVIEAKGDKKLESIVLAKVDGNGNVIKGSEFEEETSLLAIGNGLIANLDVATAAGCNTIYNENLGGLVLETNHLLETSKKGIFAAGATNGIGGADKAELEGEICAYSVLLNLKLIDANVYYELTKELSVSRKKALSFGKTLSSMQKFNLDELKNLDENTTICRCENIKLKDITEAINFGLTSINSIKKKTRAGMGNCQGKTCAELVRAILESHGHKDEKHIKTRAPLKSTSIDILAGEITFLDGSKV